MNPSNFLLRLPKACSLMRLSTSSLLLKQCGKSNRDKETCKQICADRKKKTTKRCDTMDDKKVHVHEEVEELPDHCSKQMAEECARKIKELQEQWETVAKETPERKKPSGCGVRPPKEEEEKGSNLLIYLGVGALIATIAYLIYAQTQQVRGHDDDEFNRPRSEN